MLKVHVMDLSPGRSPTGRKMLDAHMLEVSSDFPGILQGCHRLKFASTGALQNIDAEDPGEEFGPFVVLPWFFLFILIEVKALQLFRVEDDLLSVFRVGSEAPAPSDEIKNSVYEALTPKI